MERGKRRAGKGGSPRPEPGVGVVYGTGTISPTTTYRNPCTRVHARVHAAPPYQVVVPLCPQCDEGTVPSPEGPRKLGMATLRAILCDARIHNGKKNRSEIPPSTRLQVLARDRYTCRVRGCHRTSFLTVHQLTPREFGGSNRPENLAAPCSGCHAVLHESAGRFPISPEMPAVREGTGVDGSRLASRSPGFGIR